MTSTPPQEPARAEAPDGPGPSKAKRILQQVAVVLGTLFVVAQFVQVERTNPPDRHPQPWSSPRTEELARRACMNCHSHETEWPWYSYVAPASWLVAWDVHTARGELNFSKPLKAKDGEEAAEELEEGEMPPPQYLLLHSEADLTPEEKAELAAGLRATFGGGK